MRDTDSDIRTPKKHRQLNSFSYHFCIGLLDEQENWRLLHIIECQPGEYTAIVAAIEANEDCPKDSSETPAKSIHIPSCAFAELHSII